VDSNASLWVTLGLLLALGFRHGLDPDHIATVDGLTRMRYKATAYWSARLTGFQFALGHSLTILLATLIFYWQGLQLPQWLDQVGLWVSTVFLLWLGLANLRNFFSPHQHEHTSSPLQRVILKALGPFAHPMGVGFAFAISFDSLAQAGLMAAKGHELGGIWMIVLLSASFGFGMMLADTGNGLIMHWLVKRSDQMANQAGRWMSGLVGFMSLLVVFVCHTSHYLPTLDGIWDHWGGYIGAGLTLTLLLVYGVGRWHAPSKSSAMKAT